MSVRAPLRSTLGRWVGAVCLLAGGSAQAALVTVAVSGKNGKPLGSAVIAVIVKDARSVAAAGTMAQVAQKDRQFQPQLSVIQTGTSVLFPNFDTVRHHVYSFSPIRTFELKLYAGTPTAPVVFDKPGFAALGCNIHDRMSAWIVVVDTPYFAKTDAAGVAVLELPAGEHRLRAWHPQMTESTPWVEQPLRVGAQADRVALSLPVEAGL